ncbi:MAG: GNAT family N-acetyltransferase [Cellulophaga sp.]
MIRLAKIVDIADILTITKACASFMIEKSIYQWNDTYPSKSTFNLDVNRNELYVLLEESQIVGCVTISTIMDAEYIPIKWLTPNENNIYIHRLAVHPKYQGRGFAKKLMDFAEKYAKNNDFSSIRLDTFSQNKRNQKIYETRGYRKLGNIYFPKQSTHSFHCYELVL